LEELISQDLSSQQVYNVWCDHMANVEWETGSPPFPDPEVSPYEKWAIFSIHPDSHKIIGEFNTNIHSCISFQSSVQYNSQKHQLNHAKLQHVNLFALQAYLQDLPIFTRASTVKLIDRWIPTYASLHRQERTPSPFVHDVTKLLKLLNM
jgi:hypothetical protein